MDAACAPDSSWLSVEAPKSGDARNIIEALGNLCYLIQIDADNPALVRSYTAQAEERLCALAALFTASPTARTTGKGPKVVSIHSNPQAD